MLSKKHQLPAGGTTCDSLFACILCPDHGRGLQAEGFSGADLAALLREAGLDVLRQLKNREAVTGEGVYTEEGISWNTHVFAGLVNRR